MSNPSKTQPTGLSQQVAEELLKQYGQNTIGEVGKVSAWSLILSQFKSPLVFILIVASAISFALGEAHDAIFILIVVFINSSLGFYQEYKAENTLEALKKRVSKTVSVKRDGVFKTLSTDLIVPGDLIRLEPGLRIPADGQLIEANELLIDEALLTGESEPVLKTTKREDSTNQIFMGTSVIEGLGVAEIKQTGQQTKFGQIATNLHEELNPITPIKQELIKLSKIISVFIIAITIVIVIYGFWLGIEFKEIFLTSVALGVSTIPEGLLISLTVTLALGMNRIMSKKAIVKNLPAAETLGDIDVLCVDKTGTLTMGNMQVSDTEFNDKDQAIRALAICNNKVNFIDSALFSFIIDELGHDYLEEAQKSRQKLFPFSSLKKYTGAFDGKHLFAVGAPEIIFGFSAAVEDKWKQLVEQRAEQGARMIAVASKPFSKQPTREDFHSMHFLGLVFVKDPVRQSAAASIKKLQSAGIELKVITGDLKQTAINVLYSLDFPIKENQILSGEQLAQIQDEEELAQAVKHTTLFYRTSPDQKLKIVKSLQSQDLRVGMMGDGVNDAPAIKRSEIGICVDNATDVSKEVADLILLDSNFETIINAVEEGRNIIKNLRKILIFLFADSLSETILILLALLFGLPLPLTPVLLLWINLLEDGLPSLALSFEKSSESLLKNKPRSRHASLLDRKALGVIITTSLATDVAYFFIFRYLMMHGYELVFAQTFIFTGIIISSLLFLFSAKTIDSNIWKEPIFDNKVVNLAIGIGFGLLFASLYWQPLNDFLGTTSLNVTQLTIVFVISIIDTLMVETVKYFMHKSDQGKN